MTMFDMAIGNSGYPIQLLWLIDGLESDMVQRYRDHWLEQDDGDLILAVYTRTGGDNRREYGESLRRQSELRQFVSDDDDTFDNTYQTTRFRITRADFQSFYEAHDKEREIPFEVLWTELWKEAQPVRRNMDDVWRAMIQNLANQAQSTD